MCDDALEFCLKKGLTFGEICRTVEERFKTEVLDELLEGVIFQLAQGGFGLDYGSDKCSEESEFHCSL